MNKNLAFFFLISSSLCFGQISPGNAKIYSWFDNEVGIENTRLYNGIEYIEKHRTINEKNKFFFSNSTVIGEILYDGEWFTDLPLKYNVFEDLLLIQLESGSGKSILQPVKDKVERFHLNNHIFLNILPRSAGNSGTGFHEVLWESSDLAILKKHSKKLIEKRDRKVEYFEFNYLKPNYVLRFNDQFFNLNSKRDMVRIFPENEELIDKFYKNNSSLVRRQPDIFFVNLLKELSSLNGEMN